MGRASIKIDLDDPLMSENLEGPYTEDKRIRAERRWRRRESMNESLKHYNHCASAARKTLKTRGNKSVLTDRKDHMAEDIIDIDDDYKSYLDTLASGVDSAGDNNVGGSGIGVDTGYSSDNDEIIDADYKTFLDAYASDVDIAFDNNVGGGSGIGVNTGCNIDNDDDYDHDYKMYFENMRDYEEEEEEQEERLHKKVKLDTRMSKESQQRLETERGPCDKRNNWHCDVDEDYLLFLNSGRIDGEPIGRSSSFLQNSQVSDQSFDTHEVQYEIDEDYQQILNSARIVDGDLVFMPDKNAAKTSKVEGSSNSSDSDLILIEPDPICEDTPFISSKLYDSSWFEKEMNPRSSRQLSSDGHYHFRRRLMEYLERPYDQQEYDMILLEVNQQKQKERHVETRQGVIKSYRAKGVNKSYLELYPDLAKAIAEFKEPHRVLFLLRGFIFWLTNLCNDGIFRPWLDKSCLEVLRRM